MVKTYKTFGYLSIPLTVNKKTVRIEFIGNRETGAFYTTKDASIQKAIEGHKKFNSSIFLHGKGKEEENPAKKPNKSMKAVEGVDSFQSAKAYLLQKGYVAINTPDEIKEAANKLNIYFPNLKI